MSMAHAGRLIVILPGAGDGVQGCLNKRSGENRPIAGTAAVSGFSPEDLQIFSGWLDDLAAGVQIPLRLANIEAIEALPDYPDLKDDLSGLRGKVVCAGLAADVYLCAECGSSFDLAWFLADQGLLREWDAVLAMRQTAGRGQLRRHWHSPVGNLHVSFRLPDRFLDWEAASVLTALLLVWGFAGLGLDLKLKWPNDLVLGSDDEPGKLAGMLLEERSGRLVAGLGVNCAHMPDSGQLRRDAAMKAVVLPEDFPFRSAPVLWSRLVHHLILRYEKTIKATHVKELLRQSEKHLLWKGSEVQVWDHYDEGSATTGVLCGLTDLGGLRLLVPAAARKALRSPSSSGSPGLQDSPERPCSSTLRNAYGHCGLEEISIYSGSVKKR